MKHGWTRIFGVNEFLLPSAASAKSAVCGSMTWPVRYSAKTTVHSPASTGYDLFDSPRLHSHLR